MKFPKVIYNGPPQNHSWCRWMVNRVKNLNNSVNVRFIGDTGSGKSWSALWTLEELGRLMGKKVNEENMYFSIGDVIRKVAKDKPKPGTIFFIDEQQVEGDSNEHNTIRGRAYTTFFSTVRSKRYIILSTVPFTDMIIKKVRRFFHIEIETFGANQSTNTVKSKPRFLEYQKNKDKVYYKRLVVVFRTPEGNMKARKLDSWDIPKPSQELIDKYEKAKQEFQDKTYDRLVKDLDKFEGRDKPLDKGQLEELEENVLTPFQKALLILIRKGVTNQTEMAKLCLEQGFIADQSKVSRNIKWILKKGIKL